VIISVFNWHSDHVDDPKLWTSQLSGWRLVLFLVVGVVALVGCAMIGYIIYSQTSDQSRKRLF